MSIVLENESYVGSYADINDDGTVDGVIFADLAVGGSETWRKFLGNIYNSKRRKFDTRQRQLITPTSVVVSLLMAE